MRIRRHERSVAEGVIDPGWELPASDAASPTWTEAPHKDWEAARMAVYAAQVDRMDQRVGDIVDALEAAGRLEDTLVVFFSDNGASAEELLPGDQSMSQVPASTRDGRPITHGNVPGVMPGGADTFMSYGLPWAQLSNTPFRRYKSWAHEGGVATPFIAHAPGLVPAGHIAHGVGHVVDVLPTLLELTGAHYPRTFRGRDIQSLEGVSLLPLLRGSTPWSRGPLCWEHEGKRAVRTERWKLVALHNAPWELYDMSADRTECHDLAATHPDIVDELDRLYQAWAHRLRIVPWDTLGKQLQRTDVEERAAREATAAAER
jgi:arylsulfatase